MGCFCAVPEEFYCEVLLLDESKLTLTTQQQGIKVGAAGARCRVRDVGVRGFVSRLSPVQPGRPPWNSGAAVPASDRGGVCGAALSWRCFRKVTAVSKGPRRPNFQQQLEPWRLCPLPGSPSSS